MKDDDSTSIKVSFADSSSKARSVVTESSSAWAGSSVTCASNSSTIEASVSFGNESSRLVSTDGANDELSIGVSVAISSKIGGGSSGSLSLNALVSLTAEFFSKVSITGASVGVVGEVTFKVS